MKDKKSVRNTVRRKRSCAGKKACRKIAAMLGKFFQDLADGCRKFSVLCEEAESFPAPACRKPSRILILGASNAPVRKLFGKAKDFGFRRDQVIYYDYTTVRQRDCERWRNAPDIAAIFCGPVPHSSKGIGKADSLLGVLQNGEGFPPVYPVRSANGSLKISGASFEKALAQFQFDRAAA